MSETDKILVRTSPELHRSLLATAKERGASLNELCLKRLGVPSSLEGVGDELLWSVTAAVHRMLGSDLVGVVLYGSQARGMATTQSDWDILVVPALSVTLNRGLYRRCDEATKDLPGAVEIHFAHLPTVTRTATGFWSEVALDAIVLFEQGWRISRHLTKVRRDIASGLIVRRMLHGQSYWVRTDAA